METCCTCAKILSATPPYPAEKEKEAEALPEDRRVRCCSRIICGRCIHNNERFAEYCPYCQISTVPSSLPQRLREPPSYTSLPSSSARTAEVSDLPPPYTAKTTPKPQDFDPEKAALAMEDEAAGAEDILHFLDHEHDSVTSLSLRYGVPANALRQTNKITSDHLLLGRRTVLIPGKYYKGGVSLSPRPVEGEEEERRKNKIRRFMTSCKVSDYDIALVYLEQSGYDVEVAVGAYFDDELWDKQHPHEPRRKDKAKKPYKNRGPFWRGL